MQVQILPHCNDSRERPALEFMKELKAISIGAAACVLGAALLDCELKTTGVTFMCLGVMAILFGPLACGFLDTKD